MLASVRAGFAAALVAFFSFTAFAADKPFQRSDLADSAIRLETQIKTESGQVAKPVATLRSEAEAAFGKRDFRAGMQTLAQIVSVAPREAGNWLRLSRAILQIRPNDDRERTNFLERAATAAYIAYQRSGNKGEEADALVLLGRTFSDRKLWRPALDAYRFSLDLREVAEVRQSYEQLRDQHGFRILDYSVDADAASPRACFQFSEELPGKRTDFSPFVALEGTDKPAITTEEKQLCVEGLKHGERYSITLRAGLPSTVKETLQKSADYNIYVRDRAPYVRFTGKAYVLPRNGQRGIPVVSVNTASVKVKVHRIGDRNLIETVLGYDFQRNIDRYDRRKLDNEKGQLAWEGELKIDSVLNADVTTAFPIDQAIGDLKPGIYVMTAEPEGRPRDEDYGQLATQWFIVSDLGLTSFSGNDGINVFLHSLATTDAKAGIEIRLVARNNEVLATRTTDAQGFAHFEAGFTRGEGGLAPAMIVADGKGDYAFLSLKTSAFDLTDRGVAGRTVTAGLDAFVYAERGVYRTGETVHLTTLLARLQGHRRHRRAHDSGNRTSGRRRVSPHGRAGSGHRRALALLPDDLVGADRHVQGARLHRSERTVGRRRQLPGRRLCARSHGVRPRVADWQDFEGNAGRSHRRRPLPLWRAGVGSRSRRRDEDQGRDAAAGIRGLQLWRQRRRG